MGISSSFSFSCQTCNVQKCPQTCWRWLFEIEGGLCKVREPIFLFVLSWYLPSIVDTLRDQKLRKEWKLKIKKINQTPYPFKPECSGSGWCLSYWTTTFELKGCCITSPSSGSNGRVSAVYVVGSRSKFQLGWFVDFFFFRFCSEASLPFSCPLLFTSGCSKNSLLRI